MAAIPASVPEGIALDDTLILIVDDDPAIRVSVAAGLEFLGFRVAMAGDGQSALHEIRATEPALLLLDMHMPLLDGRAVARELSRLGIDIPIILMTAASNAEELAREIGAIAWITKPFDFGRLFATIQRIAGSSA